MINPKAKPARMIALALLLAVAACSSREEKASEAAARASQLFDAGDFSGAADSIHKAIGQRDDMADYWILLGRIELSRGSYSGAYQAYTRAIELNRTNVEAIQLLAELGVAGQRLDEADSYADQLLALNPQNYRAMLVKASVALRRKRYDDAQRINDVVLAADASNEDAQITKARILAGQGKGAEAIDYLEKIAKARGDTVPTVSTLRDLYRAQHDGKGLERTYGRLFQLSPRDNALRLDYARELYLNGENARALAMIDGLQKANANDARIQEGIVNLWLEIGPRAVGIDEVRRRAASGPPAEKIALARYALEEGYPADAEQWLRPFAADGTPNAANVDAAALYAGSLQGLERTKEALDRANDILAYDATNAGALLVRIRIWLARRDFDSAVRDAQLFIRDNRFRAANRTILGKVYAARKDYALADGAFGEAMRDMPADIHVFDDYLAYLVGLGRKADALRLAGDFTAGNPELAAGWKRRASLCRALGDAACEQASLAAAGTLRGGDGKPAAVD